MVTLQLGGELARLACRVRVHFHNFEAAAALKQLAIFWLVCAAAGFAAAASMAVLLSMAIDHQLSWRRPAPIPIARVLENLRPRPHETFDAGL